MQMKAYLKTRQFWRTVALMVGASLLIIVLTTLSLRLFTRHREAYIVSDFTGRTLEQLKVYSKNKKYKFEFVVIDSVYDKKRTPGTVLRHDPARGATVKRGRKFYVTLVSSTPDMIAMPNLVDLSLRQATALLQSKGLFVGSVTYRPGYFQNAVLDQLYRGKHISPGDRVRKGAIINLIVSGTKQHIPTDDEDDG